MNVEKEKEKIRTEMRAKLAAEPVDERKKRSRMVCHKILKDSRFESAKTIMFYVSTDEEVDTHELMAEAVKAKKTILVPAVDPRNKLLSPCKIHDPAKDLVSGNYGILEPKPELRKPVSNDLIDLVLVPGLAFDQTNNRLGRSGGYYDRFLAKLPKKTVAYGLAFQFQILTSLPVTELDIPVARVFHD